MFEGLFQPSHLLVIIVIALFVFGPKKIPELGKGLGEAIRGFKGAIEEKPQASQSSAAAAPAAAPAPAPAPTVEPKPPAQA